MKRVLPPPPPPPSPRIIIEGVIKACTICNSSMIKTGFMGLFGPEVCVNDNCPNGYKNIQKKI